MQFSTYGYGAYGVGGSAGTNGYATNTYIPYLTYYTTTPRFEKFAEKENPMLKPGTVQALGGHRAVIFHGNEIIAEFEPRKSQEKAFRDAERFIRDMLVKLAADTAE